MIVIARRPLIVAAGAALGVPFVPTPRVAGNFASRTTAAFNPPANSLLLMGFFNRQLAAFGPSTLTDNSSGALAWTVLADKLRDPGSGTRARQRIYGTIIGPSPPIGLTVTSTNTAARTTIHSLCLIGPTALPTNFDNDPSGIDSGGDPIATWPTAPAATSTLLAMFGASAAGDTPIDPPIGGGTWIELEDLYDSGGASQVQSCYLVGNSSPATTTWNSAIVGAAFGSVMEIPLP